VSITIDLSGVVALVTGAGRGIGREIVLRLAEAGAAVAINDFAGEEECHALAGDVERMGGRVLVVMADVGDEQAVQAMVERVEAELGPLEVLVNNAGITRDGVLLTMSSEDFDAVVRTHLRGTFLLSKAAARRMFRRRRGAIINLSSVVGRRGNAGQANYAAAKAGVIGLTKSMARELGARGVRVNAIAPGYVDTPMTRAMPESARAAILASTPMADIGQPRDVADAVLFLASPLARFVTGCVLPVDGGLGM
jgi:3-oxoacyl-[acyl-carrier protein] reductase